METNFKVQQNFNQLSDDVTFTALFNKKFMSKYTNFNSFGELLTDGNYEVNSKRDFADLPKKEFDKHLTCCTRFTSWKEMFSIASHEYFDSFLKF